MLLALFVGAGIGLMIGVLMGLVSSPVVGTVTGTVVTVVAAFIGFKDVEQGTSPNAKGIRARQVGAGAFGVFGVLGIIWGVYLRAHDTLSPDPKEQIRRWTDAGYSAEEARAIALARMGLSPARAGEGRGQLAVGLIYDRTDTAGCRATDPAANKGARNLLKAFDRAGGQWRLIAMSLDNADTAKQLAALSRVRADICAGIVP